jgi:Ca2+-transporting ATPase
MTLVQAIHTAVPGRARFNIQGLYRSDSLKRLLEVDLAGCEGIKSVSASTVTGNVLVHFNSNQKPSDIASLIEEVVNNHPAFSKASSGKGLTVSGDGPLRLRELLSTGKRNRTPHERLLSPPVRKTLPSLQPSAPTAPPSRGKLRRLVIHGENQTARPWHLMTADSVLGELGTDGTFGLACAAAEKALKKFGPNILPEAVPRSRWTIFIEQFKSLPVYLLGGAAAVSILTGGIVDAIAIMTVVGINAVIGYVTESNSEKVIHSLKTLVRPSALVNREGHVQDIGSEKVVPGDLLVLRPGSYVPADARLVAAQHLCIDESILTGESMPVTKHPGVLADPNLPLADRINMVYMGTLVTGGQGIAVVVATGKFTEFGQIQILIGEAESPETPMEKQLKKVGSQLVYISCAVCGLVFVMGLLWGYGLLEMYKVSISLAVAAVPEGLPAVATTTLALGIRNMQRHHALIRHLEAVETLGSVQTVCLDKTGTITMNRMSVAALCVNGERLRVNDHRILSGNVERSPYACEELLRLMHVLALCNESEVIRQGNEYLVDGSSTENALLYLAIGSGVDVLGLRADYPLARINHRSENRNFMATLHEKADASSRLLAVKGSPTEVLANCNYHLREGKKIALSPEDRLSIETENERMAGEALRVLGAAYALLPHGETPSETEMEGGEELIWIGLVGMGDPIRPGVKELIHQFHRAGIDTAMITGDQTPTAFAIGKELNLSKMEQLEILDSTHLQEMDPEVLKALCEKVLVFSRVSPAHKLQIVHALQHAGKVVAMTGDGINDGPALKAADIGIAMGHTGTDVAREVADVVLEDDNLETMIIAVSQGRTIYNNIRKTVHYLLSTNLSEIMVTFTATAAGLGQPLNAMQLLWINLVSDIFPGLALALEPPEPDVLSQPPRDPKEPIIQSKDFKRITFEAATLTGGAIGAYGMGRMRYGTGPRASTLAFLSLSTGQILHALSCRSKRRRIFGGSREQGALQPNPHLTLALGGSLALQAAAAFVPPLRSLLGTAPITPFDGLIIGASSLWPLAVNEATK